ncbi:MAG TPA: transglutaminase-like domain-containing protein, partial [Bacteroidales bacterium]
MNSRLDIGFITSGYRTIRDGGDYNKFFTSPDGNDHVIRNGDVFETVDLMKRVVWKYIDDTKRIASYLKRLTLKETCQNIWNFLYHHIQYKLDEKGLEQLRRPNRSWAERKVGIDCDCFSIFVSSILTNLQIQHSFRITKYERDSFQHVYVVVPITGSANEYIIDCVLSKFNYEKPYTAKKDFPMSLDKINIAVLSGFTPDVMDIVNGLDGLDDMELLGADAEVIRSQAIYEHLVKTRNLIAQKPHLIAQVDYPPAFLQMLDYAIANWHTPNRTAALENLARNEDVLNRLNGMEGMPDETELDGTDDLWGFLDELSLGEIEDELGKASRKKRKAKRAGRKKSKKGFFRKIGQAVKKGAQKAVKAVVRFNPLSIAARNGFLLFLKLNIKKVASRLKWGYATQQQATAKGVSTQQWERSKKALSKIEKLFADKLQGKKSALKNAILKGKAGGLNGFGGDEEVDIRGLGVAPAAALAAAVPVIAAALKIMKDTGLMKNDEAQNVTSEVNTKASEAESVPLTPETAPSQEQSIPEPTPSPAQEIPAPTTQSNTPTYTPETAPSEFTAQDTSAPQESEATEDNVPAVPESPTEPESPAPESFNTESTKSSSTDDTPITPSEEVPSEP